MSLQLQSPVRYFRLSALLARKAVLDARVARKSPDAAAAVVRAHQVASAQLAINASTAILAEQGIVAPSTVDLNSDAFAETVAEFTRQLEQIKTDWQFDRLVGSLTQTAGREAMALSVAARPRIGWIRMINPPCCGRCAVLAGRFYRWSDGFQRHPNCDCVNVPTTESSADTHGLITNPNALVEDGQVKGLSKGDLLLIEEHGADLNQVVNIRRAAAGLTDGRTVLSRAGRLTPAGILKEADGDRSRIAVLLRQNGYAS